MKKIPFAKPYITSEEQEAVRGVLRSGWLIQGEQVQKFENKIRAFTGCKYAVATSSCTTALHLACRLAGIQPGDEVLTTAYTFISSVNALLYTGAVPRFIDIDEKTFNINPSLLEGSITKKTKVILAVHQFGLPPDIAAITRAAKKHGLEVIEDAACALGSCYNGRPVGSQGRFVCFSFHPRKIITSSEGGVLATDNARIANRARSLRSHGATFFHPGRGGNPELNYEHYVEPGYNYRMSDVHAAIGVAQMTKLKDIIKRREQICARYTRFIRRLGAGIQPPFVPGTLRTNFQSYAVLLPARLKSHRDAIIKAMLLKGVSCRRGIRPLYKERHVRNVVGNLVLPVTESVYERTILLPVYTQLSQSDQRYVMDCFAHAVRNAEKKKLF